MSTPRLDAAKAAAGNAATDRWISACAATHAASTASSEAASRFYKHAPAAVVADVRAALARRGALTQAALDARVQLANALQQEGVVLAGSDFAELLSAPVFVLTGFPVHDGSPSVRAADPSGRAPCKSFGGPFFSFALALGLGSDLLMAGADVLTEPHKHDACDTFGPDKYRKMAYMCASSTRASSPS